MRAENLHNFRRVFVALIHKEGPSIKGSGEKMHLDLFGRCACMFYRLNFLPKPYVIFSYFSVAKTCLRTKLYKNNG